ncbi:polysaccharide deacetylase family protein [Paenibacillus thailandensis]|uniref:Polysaccharide deacetylase family protein n=1 Tax=Paenibacillus thailandensis TaxID=393250 RepID=A0ABW5R118_9BACL
MKIRHVITLLAMLQLALLPAAAFQADAAALAHYKDKAIVLMYHDLAYAESKTRSATITPARLGSHLKTLKDNGYNVISIEQFYDFMLNGGKVPENAVVLTFDDGYESFYSLAAPVLKKYGMKAANFVIGSSTDLNDKETKHMTWEQMKKLKKEGFSFYSHTYDLHYYAPLNEKGTRTGPALMHRIYSAARGGQETLNEYKARVASDLNLMESKLAGQLGNTYQMLSYPYGEYNNMSKKLAKEAGIGLFFTIEPGINQAGDDTVRRINAGTPAMSGAKLLETLRAYDQPL